MTDVTISEVFKDKQNRDGVSEFSANNQFLTAGDINIQSGFWEGFLAAAGLTGTSTLDVDPTTKKLINKQEIVRYLNQLVSNHYSATGTDFFQLVAPDANTNLFPNTLVSGRTAFVFQIPNTNTITQITLSVPTVTTTPLKMFKFDGVTEFAVGEFSAGQVTTAVYDETLDGGAGGFKCTVGVDLSYIQSNLDATDTSKGVVQMAAGATTNTVYDQTQTDNLLNAKADTNTVYDQTQTDNLLNGKVDTALSSANILIGNGSNIATSRAMSGDVLINSTGVTRIDSDVNLPGDPTVTTQNRSDSSNRIANTEFVKRVGYIAGVSRIGLLPINTDITLVNNAFLKLTVLTSNYPLQCSITVNGDERDSITLTATGATIHSLTCFANAGDVIRYNIPSLPSGASFTTYRNDLSDL